MKLKNIILHQIIRENEDEPELNCSDHNLVPNETVDEFVEKLVKIYSSKNPTFGSFEDDSVNYPFQKKVREYLKKSDFLSFSVESMNILKKEIKTPKATGGYVVFVHYEEKKVDFIITAMLDKSTQFAVDDTSLGIEKLKTLDIDKLARANRINIKKWNDKESQYLTFIKGTRDVSKYFQKFIGSTDITSAKINSRIIDNAVNRYLRDKKIVGERKNYVKERISNYFETQFANGEDIYLDAISSLINAVNPTDFTEYLAVNEIEVSANFSLSRKDDFILFRKSNVKEKGYNFNFEKELAKNGKIVRDGNDIIIRDVPTEQLDSAFDV